MSMSSRTSIISATRRPRTEGLAYSTGRENRWGCSAAAGGSLAGKPYVEDVQTEVSLSILIHDEPAV